MIRNGKGWLVEIGASHQTRWNILREHNWGPLSSYYVYILCYMGTCVCRCIHNTIFTCMRIIIPMITLRVFGVMFGPYWAEINKEK